MADKKIKVTKNGPYLVSGNLSLKKEITIRYFATNQPNIFLVFDGKDWWLESEQPKE